jgi:hypothetical protein
MAMAADFAPELAWLHEKRQDAKTRNDGPGGHGSGLDLRDMRVMGIWVQCGMRVLAA